MKHLRRIILFLAVLPVWGGGLYGQVTISGTVADADSKETLTGVIIALKNAGGKTLKYATTDAAG